VKQSRGTTLVELLVVLALLSIMVIIAAELVTHSIRLLGATGRAVRNPMMVHVVGRLRNDVQTAVGLPIEEPIWSDGPLELRTHNSQLIRIALVDGNLMRKSVSLAGGGSEERALLRGVTSWWWRSPSPGVVDINIGYLVNPAPERRASREVGAERERRQENLRFAIRSAGGGQRW